MATFPNPSGRPCLNLVSTVGSRLTSSPNERLRTPADLDAWLATQDLPTSSATEADLAAARALREAVHLLIDAAVTTARADPSALEVVNTAAQRAPRPRLTWTDAGYATEAAERTPTDAFALIAADTVALLGGPDRDRLHVCEADHCATPFLTGSTARPRRWCLSATCGNRARVTAHRQRTRG